VTEQTFLNLAAVAVFIAALLIALRGYRWAGKPRVRVVQNHGRLSWLDEQDRAHRKH
jgi:hypothetical protein